MLKGPILRLRSQTRNTNWVLQAAASAGDGYRGKTSPHTPSETFYGVTVLKALKVRVAVGRGEKQAVETREGVGLKAGSCPCLPNPPGAEPMSFLSPAAGPGGQGPPAERLPLLQRDREGAAHDGVLLPPGGPATLLLLPPGVPHSHRW